MTAPPLLTVDLGNSSCKLVLWPRPPARWSPQLAPLRSLRTSLEPGRMARSARDFLQGGPLPERALISAVASSELEQELTRVLTDLLGDGRVSVPDCGLELDVREAHTVGMDRRYAARGAAWVLGRSALVLDAGTALTVDALVLEQGGRARFSGGAIAPGPELSATALARAGARLPEVELRPGVPALGRSTPEAIAAGAVVGFRGAARELVLRVGEESGLQRAPIVLTGGARGYLLEPQLFAPERLTVLPDLVHLGLLAAGDLAE